VPRKKKRRPKGYVPPPSPARRATPWVSVCIRAEHYAMLRELGEFYQATLSSVAATLVAQQFVLVLDTVDPEQAKQLRRELTHEKYSKDIIDLNVSS
jgi:hypothetical protein